MDICGNPPAITVTRQDFERLSELTDLVQPHHENGIMAVAFLARELERAALVDQPSPKLVTMGSRLIYRNEATQEGRIVQLVYPGEQNIDEGRISILTPVGAALLGLSEGQSIEWSMPDGEQRRLTVLCILADNAN